MARLLAIEWDAREARLAVARTRGTDVVMEDAFTVDLAPHESGQTFADVNVGERIAAALAARNHGRGEVLVAVGRASIELRQLTLPPVPPEELPEMVRFQALRQFTTISEDWALDFVPLSRPDSENSEVLAAAISPKMVDQIRNACQAADLTTKRLILRPFAAASLLRRHDRGKDVPARLMVDLLADEADLTVLVEQQVVLMRTVRLPAAESSVKVSQQMVAAVQGKALINEVRRTIAAAQNQTRGRRIERVIVCGGGDDQNTLKETIEKELTLDVELFDPFGELKLSRELQNQQPAHPGRFAPLIGMLLDEAAGAAHAIDFLHPRKKPAPPNNRRRNVLIGATSVAMALAIVMMLWLQLKAMDVEIDDLTFESNALKKKVELANSQQANLDQINTFLASDITWLDELKSLADNLPPAEQLLVTQLNFSTRSPAGGQIVIEGYVRDSDQLKLVQKSLRAGDRRVISTGGQVDDRRPEYRWRFKETVVLEPGGKSSALAAPQPDAKQAQPPAKNLETADAAPSQEVQTR